VFRKQPTLPQAVYPKDSYPSSLEEGARNAFLNSKGDRLVPMENENGMILPSSDFLPTSSRTYSVEVPEPVKSFVSVNTPPLSEETLALPLIPDSELAVDSSGVKTAEEYIKHFIAFSGEVQFDSKRFQSALRNSDGVAILPANLMEQALERNSFVEIKPSLLIWKEFISAKLAFMKGIKVYGEAVLVQKRMLGFDELTLGLIEDALKVEEGKMMRAEFENFFKKFRATARQENRELGKQFQLARLQRDGGFFDRLLAWFGILPVSAANPPLGATLGQPLMCTCENAYWIPVTGPTVPPIGSIWVPMTFLSSPLYYDNQTMRAGVWWLGLYTQGIQTCKDASDECSGVWRQGAPIFMTGTNS